MAERERLIAEAQKFAEGLFAATDTMNKICFIDGAKYIIKQHTLPLIAENDRLERLLDVEARDSGVYQNMAKKLAEENERLKKEIEEANAKYQKCIKVIKRFDAGIIGMYDL